MSEAENATAGVPVVRGLEWRQLTSPRVDGPSDLIAEWESDCVIGTYIIKDDGAEWWLHLADLFDVQQVGRSSDPDLLRNVAQADYEQRILSALNPDFLSALDTARAEIERLRGERTYFSGLAEEQHNIDVAALTAAQARIADALLAFDEIADLSRHLRQGGADPMDLAGLDEGLSAAVDIAVTARATLSPAVKEPM